MRPAAPEISICPGCGGALEETSCGGLACMVCLVRVGIGSEDAEFGAGSFWEDDRFGVYEIERREDGSLYELGRGAMGVTYRAIDTSLRRRVALKIINIGIAKRSAEARERFMREARAAAALRHENIATVFQFGIREETGQCFYAMELIEGETLEERVRRTGPLDVRAAVDIGQQVAAALVAAEKSGVIHRDLKPANLMLVSSEGERASADQNDEKLLVKIIDFGLAKALNAPVDPMSLTRDGFVGTPAFASPEQFENATLDVRADIYSLGATLWFALTGKTPFGGQSLEEIHRAQQSKGLPIEQLKAVHVPHRLISLLKSMLALEPGTRPNTHELATRLRRSSGRPTGMGRARNVLAVAIILILGLTAFFAFRSLRMHSAAADSALNPGPPEKSIAVLPFENLSRDPDNAFFAGGVQDEILTDLALIADLKVIGRTSVMQYKSGVARNLRKIGQQLGVAHLVEGSVQRSDSRVRVNAQLVDARTERRLWGQTYDRELADVFAIQSEIAKAIAEQLHAKLSPNEKREIERPPTSEITAFDLYTRAKDLHLTTSLSATAAADLLRAADLLNDAVARDPSFFQAYCLLAHTHDLLYYFAIDHTPARLALAEAAIEAAFHLRPDSGEAYLARAENLYRGYLDYDGALADLEIAGQTLPNDPRVFELKGYIERRQGRWKEATRDLQHSIDLDPRDAFMVRRMAWQYLFLRRYAEEKSVLERALAIEPNDATTKVWLAAVELDWKADTQPLHQIVESIRTTNPDALPAISERWLICALAERDAVGAKDALIAAGENNPPWADDAIQFSRLFMEGVIARMTKDENKARSAFIAARAEQEKIVLAQPSFGPPLCVLGLIDAALGRKEEALREGRRAIELLPVEKDAINGPLMIQYSAMIAAWVGEKDLACEQLAAAVPFPGPLSYGRLKLLPFWDALRGDPRFEKIGNSLSRPLHTPSAPARSALTPAIPTKSIAVLPFENLSGDPDNAYFADGIQEEILNRLSRISDLKVISRTSTQRYKSAQKNVLEIARRLGVANILEGTVQKTEGQVRVNVQLIDARNDSHLWAEKYDRKLIDIFAVESEIAAKIAESLQAKLSDAEQKVLDSRPTKSTEAHQLYLRARFLMEKRTADDVKKAAEYFKQAIAQDPIYAATYAGLADCYVLLPNWEPGSHAAYLSKARAAANQALQIDSDLADAHVSLGMIAFKETLDLQEARREFERAIQLNPNYALAHYWLAYSVLLALGDHERAIAGLERAIELDPVSSIINTNLGTAYIQARRYPEAIAQLRKTIELEPRFGYAHAMLGVALELTGSLDEAFTEYEKCYNLGDHRGLMMMAHVHGLKGDRAKALQSLEQAKQLSSPHIWAYGCAMVYLALGERHETLAWLEQSYRQKEFINISTIKEDPLFDSLHGDPRFEKIVNSLAPKSD
jgi:serine/threonine-protein kinase